MERGVRDAVGDALEYGVLGVIGERRVKLFLSSSIASNESNLPRLAEKRGVLCDDDRGVAEA
jgi:hypothetical protein